MEAVVYYEVVQTSVSTTPYIRYSNYEIFKSPIGVVWNKQYFRDWTGLRITDYTLSGLF